MWGEGGGGTAVTGARAERTHARLCPGAGGVVGLVALLPIYAKHRHERRQRQLAEARLKAA